MNPNLECCVLGCHTKPNQGLIFYRFPCHNPQVNSIWERRICQSANIDFLNDQVCELHFDYRYKTGNDCALEEGSLPTLHLPSFGTLFPTSNAHFQMSANRIEELSYTISIDALSYHCRFCLRRGLLYEVEASTYRSKSFLSLIDLPQHLLPYNTQPNACLSCMKSIVISHQLSMAVEHSNTILQLLLQHPKQSKVVSNTNFFDVKSELSFCNLIQANSLSIKLEIEYEDNIVCANEDYEQKWVATGESTSPESISIAINRDNVCNMNASEMQYKKEYHKFFAIREEYTTDLSAEGILNASVIMKNADDNAEFMAANADVSCVDDRQFDNEQTPESTSKAVKESTFKYDLCGFTTNYNANLEIHKNRHLSGHDKVHFYCQKCGKYFLLRRHFARHNAIVHSDDFICKICDKPHSSARKLTVHYAEYQHFRCDIYIQGQTSFNTIDGNAHWNENDGVYVCPICDWKNSLFYTFSMHMGEHKVQSDKNIAVGQEELEALKTDPVRNVGGRYQSDTDRQRTFDFGQPKRIHATETRYKCAEFPKTFNQNSTLIQHKIIHTNERSYKCTQCPKTFITKSNLVVHMRIHTNERPYKCTECPKTFSQSSNLNRHVKIHTNERLYKCTSCPKTFSQKSKFDVHRKIHTNEKPYKCTECSKVFRFNSKLREHKKIHTIEGPYKCTECSKAFRLISNLRKHNIIHTNKRSYKCTECQKTFSRNSGLTLHKRIHTNEKPYKCTECPKVFRFNSSFREHKRIHTTETRYKCTECPKTFSHPSNLNIHKRIHTGEKPYKCTECQKTFRWRRSLDIHIRIHSNERPYKCTECPKTFNHKKSLYMHQRIHTTEIRYKCTECPQTFSRPSNLIAHNRIHTGEKPYKCTECTKTFSQNSTLSRHKRIHTKEKHKCKFCPREFNHCPDLKRHVLRNHSDRKTTIP